MKELLTQTAEIASRYLDTLDDRGVRPDPDAVVALSALLEPLPDSGCSPEEVLSLLDQYGSPATIGTAGSRFFGFVIGGALPATLAANWLANTWDQNTAMAKVTPATSLLENLSLKWLLSLLELPETHGGAFVTGATVANFTALAAARNYVLNQAGWNVEADGLFGAPEIQVVVGKEAHPTLLKSLGMLGLGRNRIQWVDVDNQGRMRTDCLPEITGPAIICTQVGNINTGAFDPVADICKSVAGLPAWVHVDGAFGLWARAVPSLKQHTLGLELADSWATDAHKWLNVPYDCGIAMVKHPEALKAAMAITAEYLPTDSDARNPSDYTPELSRRARGVEVWAALKSLGRQGLIEMVDRNARQARRFAQGFEEAGFNVLNDVVLNQVLVQFGDADTTSRVIQAIQEDGTCWCGPTIWQGHTAMRISVCSWATTDDDVEQSLAAMIRIAREFQDSP